MRTSYRIIILALATALVACGGNTPTNYTTIGTLVGTVIVTNGDGEGQDYRKDDVESTLTCTDAEQGLYDILLKKVRFSSKMPVSIDMTIAGVTIDKIGHLSADSIVPTAGLFGEYPKYTIRNLRGTVAFSPLGTPIALTIDMQCGIYPTKYNAFYQEKEE